MTTNDISTIRREDMAKIVWSNWLSAPRNWMNLSYPLGTIILELVDNQCTFRTTNEIPLGKGGISITGPNFQWSKSERATIPFKIVDIRPRLSDNNPIRNETNTSAGPSTFRDTFSSISLNYFLPDMYTSVRLGGDVVEPQASVGPCSLGEIRTLRIGNKTITTQNSTQNSAQNTTNNNPTNNSPTLRVDTSNPSRAPLIDLNDFNSSLGADLGVGPSTGAFQRQVPLTQRPTPITQTPLVPTSSLNALSTTTPLDFADLFRSAPGSTTTINQPTYESLIRPSVTQPTSPIQSSNIDSTSPPTPAYDTTSNQSGFIIDFEGESIPMEQVHFDGEYFSKNEDTPLPAQNEAVIRSNAILLAQALGTTPPEGPVRSTKAPIRRNISMGTFLFDTMLPGTWRTYLNVFTTIKGGNLYYRIPYLANGRLADFYYCPSIPLSFDAQTLNFEQNGIVLPRPSQQTLEILTDLSVYVE